MVSGADALRNVLEFAIKDLNGYMLSFGQPDK
jgi:hypothetical protein